LLCGIIICLLVLGIRLAEDAVAFIYSRLKQQRTTLQLMASYWDWLPNELHSLIFGIIEEQEHQKCKQQFNSCMTELSLFHKQVQDSRNFLNRIFRSRQLECTEDHDHMMLVLANPLLLYLGLPVHLSRGWQRFEQGKQNLGSLQRGFLRHVYPGLRDKDDQTLDGFLSKIIPKKYHYVVFENGNFQKYIPS
jgi:hypothetical protein